VAGKPRDGGTAGDAAVAAVAPRSPNPAAVAAATGVAAARVDSAMDAATVVAAVAAVEISPDDAPWRPRVNRSGPLRGAERPLRP